MQVVAFNGSARKKGNTRILIDTALDVLKREDIETEVVNLAGKKIRGCTACMQCFEKRDQTCSGPSRLSDIFIQTHVVMKL